MSDNQRDEAIKEFQSRRQIHTQRSEERQKFSHGFLTAGTGVLVVILAAAEQHNTAGHQPNLYLHWIIPFLIVAVWAFDSRFRTLSARAEELMQRVYDKQIEWLIGPEEKLDPALVKFREAHVQFYSLHRAYWWSTRFVHAVTAVPLVLILFYSVISVGSGRVPLPPLPWELFGSFAGSFRYLWMVIAVTLTCTAYVVREWRSLRFSAACRVLDAMQPLYLPWNQQQSDPQKQVT